MSSLKEYVRKRHFEKTPEPRGKIEKEAREHKSFFCVQRHDATRLHYDFRLEIDGVLKSWAVPKGPTLDPGQKHLAMHVEDHPLDYGTFEGNIPAGNYGGGSVMLWDRGTFELIGDMPGAGQIARGDLKFHLSGEKLKGDFALVHMRNRGKGNEWLLLKKRDEYAVPDWNVEDYARSVLTGRTQEEIAEDLPPVKKESKTPAQTVKSSTPEPELPQMEPMMAYLADHPPAGDQWLYEIKWDGIRALCYIENKQARILTRNGNRCEQQYPELTVLPHFIQADTAILDGEIAILDSNGRSSFSLIQPRLHVNDPNTIAHLARKTPVTLFLFDLLYLNGEDLRSKPLLERKEKLKKILKTTETIRYSDHFIARGPEMLEAARENGLEGVIAKRIDSKYEGRRSKDWLKIKVVQQQEFVIAGFTHGERAYFSSLVLGLYRKGKLVHVGQVGTGFNDRNIREVYGKLKPLITDKSPFAPPQKKILREVTWVKPELVAMIKFLEVTPDGMLRAPVFLGLRTDKDAKEVTDEQKAEPEETRTAPPGTPALTNLKKVWFPEDKITKGDVVEYYTDIAELILPHLKDRALSLKRYPNGIKDEFFFQKNAHESFPDWVRTEAIESESSRRTIHYVVCNDKPTLLYLTNLGCIDQNPWMSRIGSLDNPDYILIDLDPQECSYDKIIEAAQLVHKVLEKIGLAGYPKTTGGDGMHIYIPIDTAYSYDQARSFAEILSVFVRQQNPALFTTPRNVAARRKGTVYFDYLQIGKSKTIAAPYVLRAYPGAPVSTPLAWKEVKKGLTPDKFTISNASKRFEKTGDLFSEVLTNKQRIEDAIEKMQSM